MQIWAFGTSPHGLGLAPEAFWCLTQWEFDHLKMPWAHHQAQFHNAHFNSAGTPWIAEDFMGGGNREQRIQMRLRDEAISVMENKRLSRMKKGEVSAEIPDWAFGRKGRPDSGKHSYRRDSSPDQR